MIPIDVGRQLFVDDFLIEKTDLKRKFHQPVKYRNNPILKPETNVERNRGIVRWQLLFLMEFSLTLAIGFLNFGIWQVGLMELP